MEEYSRQRKHGHKERRTWAREVVAYAFYALVGKSRRRDLVLALRKQDFIGSTPPLPFETTIQRGTRSENAYLTRPRNLSRCKIERSSDDVIPRPRFTLPLRWGMEKEEGKKVSRFPLKIQQTFLLSSLLLPWRDAKQVFPRVSRFESKQRSMRLFHPIRVGILIIFL